MATTEREITAPGRPVRRAGALHPDARGWSRRPMLAANLKGRAGRKKRWDYWNVNSDEIVVGLTFADIDYAGLANVWVMEHAHRVPGERRRAEAVRSRAGAARPGVHRHDARTTTQGSALQIDETDEHTRLRGSGTLAAGSRWRWISSRQAGGPRVAERGDPVERPHVPVHVQAEHPSRHGHRARGRTGVDPRRGPRRLGHAGPRSGHLAVLEPVELGCRERSLRRPSWACSSAASGPSAPAPPRTHCASTACCRRSARSWSGPTTGTHPMGPWRVRTPVVRPGRRHAHAHVRPLRRPPT